MTPEARQTLAETITPASDDTGDVERGSWEGQTACKSREARYVPWSFGEVYECLTCQHRERLDHRLRPLRGEGYTAVYPFPEHIR